MIRPLRAALLLLSLSVSPALAQTGALSPIQALLQEHREAIEKSSRRTIQPAIDAIRDSGLDAAPLVLEQWGARNMWQREDDGLFFYAEEVDRDTLRIFDFATAQSIGEFPDDAFDQLKPNSGIQGLIASALVKFQLNDPDPAKRRDALAALARNGNERHLPILRESIEAEPSARIRQQKERLERLLTISFGASDAERIEAMDHFRGDLAVDVRAALNPILATTTEVV